MLGRESYNREEFDHGTPAVKEQLGLYNQLVKAIKTEAADNKLQSAFDNFEVPFFNNMVLMLNRCYVHRVRMVTGKDTNALNEVEMICDALMNNNGIFQSNNLIKYIAEQSVVGLTVGDQIRLTAKDFERLSAAFFTELERKFL